MKTQKLPYILIVVILILSIASGNAQPRNNHHRDRPEPHNRYRDLPHWGFKYRAIPRDAFILRHSGINYHYYSGIYYRPYGDSFVVVKAPIGLRVRTLPIGSVHFVVGGRRYFYYYGTYYIKSVDNDYITVAPPLGAIVDGLPEGYTKVVIDNNTYYEFEGTYYKAFLDENGEVLFEVIGVN